MSAGRSTVHRRRATALCCAAAAALLATLALLAQPPEARADAVICEAGSEAGQCSSPSGVAVDRDAGLLYVADEGNSRIDVFEANGTFLRAFGWGVDSGAAAPEVCTAASGCQAGLAGPGPGQLGTRINGIAVDNDEASPGFGDVYVFDHSNRRVQRFEPGGAFVLTFGGEVNETKTEEGAPAAERNLCTAESGDTCGAGTDGFEAGQFDERSRIAVGPGGVVHVADARVVGFDGSPITENRVQRFAASGERLGQCAVDAEERGRPRGLAVDSAGAIFFASDDFTGAVRELEWAEPACSQVALFQPSFNIQALATDAADELFVADSSGIGGRNETTTYLYDPSNTLTQVFYGNGTAKARANSLAPYAGAGGDVFLAEGGGQERVLHIAFPPEGPRVHPDPALSEADPIGNTKATLNARVNPEGEPTGYRFEYVEEEIFGESGFAEAVSTEETPLVPPEEPVPDIDPLFALAPAEAQIGCPVASEEAVEEGECLKPETKYRFRAVASNASGEDVGPTASFETKEPFEILATFAAGAGVEDATLGARVNPLGIPLAGRFEYVTEARFQESGFEGAATSAEIDFGGGEEAVLRFAQIASLQPDTAYRYRLVVENFFRSEASAPASFATFPAPGPRPACPNDAVRLGPGAGLPDCRGYEMVSPLDKGGADLIVPVTFTRVTAGLEKSAAAVPARGRGLTYTSRRPFAGAESAPFLSQYLASRDPEAGWSSRGISPRREGVAFNSLVFLDTQYKLFTEDLGSGWLRSDSEPPLDEAAIPGYSNLYERDSASGEFDSICPVEPPEVARDQYVPEPQGIAAGGEIAVFRANDKLSEGAAEAPNTYQLYACRGGELRVASVLPGGEASTGNSSVGTPTATPKGDHRRLSLHNAISADGGRIYWTDSGGVTNIPGSLYLRERPLAAGGECASEAAPCTLAVSGAVEAAGAEEEAMFWTASPDGGRAVFGFVAGPLAGDLYAFEPGSGEAPEPIAAGVSGLAGWSEDAEVLYLVSSEKLTEDAEEGASNLYRFEAGEGFELVATLPGGPSASDLCSIDQADPTKRCARATPDGDRLAFVSQDPLTEYDNTDTASGKAAAEVYLYDATAGGGAGELLCVSCNPSGARPAAQGVPVPGSPDPTPVAALIPTWESAFQASRALSADGRRLFFESFDALLPTDRNGAMDVYEWQRAGKGSCKEGDPDFFESNGGCLALISSGQSPEDSEFVDASADGSDVFFKTAESLYVPDPGLIDIYDARVGGGFPPPPAPRTPCEGEACQPSPAPPEAPQPGSESLRGQGNPGPARGDLRALARRCVRAGRIAKASSRRAQRLRRAARRAPAPRRTRALARRARRNATRAKRVSRAAKRCRTRVRRARR